MMGQHCEFKPFHRNRQKYEKGQQYTEDRQDDPRGTVSQPTYPDYCQTMLVSDGHGGVKELVFPKALDLDRPKRARTTFSPEQLYSLEREFQCNQYLVGKERTELAKRLRLSETQVKVWFQNRRTKYKRDKSKEAEQENVKAESRASGNLFQILQGGNSVLYSSPFPIVTVPSTYRF